MIKRIISIIIVTVFINLNTNAQISKKDLCTDEYRQWHNIGIGGVSHKGDRIFFYLSSVHNPDTLIIAPLGKGNYRKITEGKKGYFLDFQNLLLYQKDKQLVIENNSNDVVKTYNSIEDRLIINKGRFLLLSTKPLYYNEEKTITVVDTKGFKELSINNVLTLSVDHSGEKVVFAIQDGESQIITVLELNNWNEQSVQLLSSGVIENINWSNDDRSVIIQQTTSLYLIPDVSRLSLINFFDLKDPMNKASLEISMSNENFPKLSDKKDQIFFLVKQLSFDDKDTTKVEMWQANDKRLFPYKQKSISKTRLYRSLSMLASLDLKTNELKIISKPSESEFIIDPNGRYGIILDKEKYIPAYKYGNHFLDIRITDLQNNKDLLLEQKIPTGSHQIMFTPDGNSVLYRKSGSWLLYNLVRDTTYNLNKDIPNQITQCSNCYSGIAVSKNKPIFYIFDHNDLWSVDIRDFSTKRLSAVNNKGIEFQFARSVYGYLKVNKILEVDSESGIYIQANNKKTGESGYYKWTEKAGLEEIVYKSHKVDFLHVCPESNGYIYRQQNFDLSPEIVWKSKKNRQEKVIASSNAQQKKYNWGRSEMVYYKSESGRELNSALFYPADYKEGKKNPLLIAIYEDKTYAINEYQNPGINRFIDLNPTDYTLNGYFVLFPNLTPRQLGNPGHSMIENLQAAVNYMKSTNMIDASKIGLYGHSFGGYEALFAATQMTDFATIVAGAGISDLVSDYFSHRELLLGPNFYRVEQDQMGMKRTYYEIPELYIANSPIHHAHKITAPILLWTGKNDTNVDWSQSVEFYLAMLRLGKLCTLLVYPDENHVLADSDNLTDLDTRLKEWFAYYLKGEKPSKLFKSYLE